jgi:Lar family restriction alleviation protein
MSELKPCPFCCGDPKEPEVEQIEHDSYIARIDCENCDISVTTQYGEDSEEYAIASVIASWNRRTATGERDERGI